MPVSTGKRLVIYDDFELGSVAILTLRSMRATVRR
jgi:hypothetical protein